jgi:cytidyltransferase-like protein
VLTAAAVTGRFQPFHIGHWELLSIALAEAEEVFIGITNPDPASWHEHDSSAHRHLPDSNPFTFWERQRMIRSALDRQGVQSRCSIVPFPLDRPSAWSSYIPLSAVQFVRVFSDWERDKVGILHEGGYSVRVIEGDPAQAVRATNIRAALATEGDGSWQELLPDGVVDVLPAWVSAR